MRTTCNEVEIRKKFSPGASILFSTVSEETDWRKSLNSLKANHATEAKNSLSTARSSTKFRRFLHVVEIESTEWPNLAQQLHTWSCSPILLLRWKLCGRQRWYFRTSLRGYVALWVSSPSHFCSFLFFGSGMNRWRFSVRWWRKNWVTSCTVCSQLWWILSDDLKLVKFEMHAHRAMERRSLDETLTHN